MKLMICFSVLPQGTNRVLLQWLKLWDTAVFPRKVRQMTNRKKQQEVIKPPNPPPKPNADGKKKFVKKLPWDYSEDLVSIYFDLSYCSSVLR